MIYATVRTLFCGLLLQWSAMNSLSARLAGITLPDSDDNPITLGPVWAEAPAVVAFLRHYG